MFAKKAIAGSILVSVIPLSALSGEQPYMGVAVEQMTVREKELPKSSFPVVRFSAGTELTPYLAIQMDLGLPLQESTEGMGVATVTAEEAVTGNMLEFSGGFSTEARLGFHAGVFVKPQLPLADRGNLHLLVGAVHTRYDRDVIVTNGTLTTTPEGQSPTVETGISARLESEISFTSLAYGVGMDLQPFPAMGVSLQVMRLGTRDEESRSCDEYTTGRLRCESAAGRLSASAVSVGVKYAF